MVVIDAVLKVSSISVIFFNKDHTRKYSVNQKKNKTPYSCQQLCEILVNFRNSFTARLKRKFATKRSLHIPPHLKDIAALPCETTVFQKSHKFNNTVLKKVVLKRKLCGFTYLIFLNLLDKIKV